MNSTFFRTLLDWQLAIAPHKSTLFSIRAYVPFPPRQDECRARQGAEIATATPSLQRFPISEPWLGFSP